MVAQGAGSIEDPWGAGESDADAPQGQDRVSNLALTAADHGSFATPTYHKSWPG